MIGANGIKTELFSSGASSKALTSDLLHIIHKSEELGKSEFPIIGSNTLMSMCEIFQNLVTF
jgi:hypothetical protein